MSRQRGLFPLSANFEPNIAAPLDARLVADSLLNLTSSQYWSSSDDNVYIFQGITVAVWNDPNYENNGLYILINPDYEDINNWLKVGASNEEIIYRQGLTLSNNELSISLTQSSGLTFSENDELVVDSDNTLNITNNKLSVSGNSVYQAKNSLETSGNYQSTGMTIENTPLNHSSVSVFVNGQSLFLGISREDSDCYFSNDGGSSAKTYQEIKTGDKLYFNGQLVGWNLSIEDRIVLIYESVI